MHAAPMDQEENHDGHVKKNLDREIDREVGGAPGRAGRG
jgi:hypothetical protein